MIVVIVGPPGAGKSSQSELLRDREHIEWLYVGKLLRAQDNPDIKAVIDSGQLVDDQIVNQLVADHIEKIPANQVVVIDGFPRHLPQAKWLLEHSNKSSHKLKAVIHLMIPRDVAEQRLKGRGRQDDAPEVIDQRYAIYEHDIAPVIEYFDHADVPIHTVDGNRSEEAVFSDMDKLLADVHQS